MSNYPPPQYGTSCNPSGYMPPSAGPYNAGSSQYPHQSQTQVPYLHGRVPSNGASPAPHANAYSFNVNGQVVTPPGNGVNQTFSGYGTQPYLHSLPPPTFPPVPLSVGTSHFPQISNQASTTSTVPPTHAYLPSEPPHSQLPLRNQNTHVGGFKDVVLAASDLEDGEVDDEGSDKPSTLSETNEMGVSFSRASVQRQSEANGLTGRNLSNGNANVTHGVSSGRIQGDYFHSYPHKSNPPPYNRELILPESVVESDSQLPISSHPQRPPEPNAITGAPNRSTSPKSVGGTCTTKLPPDGATEVHGSTNTELMAKKKEDARQALLDLHTHGHDFNGLVGRGVNPTFLRMLYAEVGITIDSSPSSQLQRELEVNARGASGLNATTADNIARSKGMDSEATTQDKDANNLTKTPLVVSSEKEKDVVNSSPKKFEPRKALMNTPSGKVPGAKTADSKPMDRKEYIARMLAAKAGKPLAITNSSMPPKPSAVAALEPVSQLHTSSAAVVPSMSAATPAAQAIYQPAQDESSIELPQSHKDNQNINAKRKAQTDLARQKMGALRSQRETAKATSSNESANQIRAVSSSNALGPPIVAPMMIPKPPTPSRQGSYFSPVSQKAPFSIPGLFMTSAPLDPVKPLVSEPNQSSTASAQGQQERSLPAAGLQEAPSPTEAAHIREPVADIGNGAVPVGKDEPALNHRKRQKAADFLDSPSTRVKRPLGQQDHSSVIIDISDEDMAGSSDDESIDVDLADTRMTATKNNQTIESGSSKQKSIGDLPPSSGFPSKKKAPTITAPLGPTPSQPKDPKGLKSKELEIELMNRKIAELEQRISAKKTTSRAVTPGSSGITTVSPAPKDYSRDSEAVSEASEVPEAAFGYDNDGRTRHSYPTAADTADTAKAKRKLHEVERAKASVQRSLAAELAQASDEQRALQEVTTESVQDQAQWTPHRELQRVTESEDARLQHVEQRQVEREQRGEAQDKEISRPEGENLQSIEQENMQLQEAKQIHPQEKEQSKFLVEQRQLRRHALESGLPVLDATVAKTKQKLESMRKEIADLEMEVQKGIEGRKALIEELESLSQAVEAPPVLRGHHRPDRLSHVEQPLEKAASQAATVFPIPIEIIDNSEAPESKSLETAGTFQEPATTLQEEDAYASAPPLQAATTADEQLSDGELEEDVMDISRSEIDEGELSEYSPKLPNAEVLRTKNLVDDEEGYEPPSDSGVVQQQSIPDRVPMNGEFVEIEIPDAGLESPLSNEEEQGVPSRVDELDHKANPHDEEQLSHPSLSLADDSDSNDYEPPEPALPPKLSAVEPESSISPPSVDVTGIMAPVQPNSQACLGHISTTSKAIVPTPQEGTILAPIRTNRHFTPYESPLKQFKSYRNHPEYLNEVSHGFRSLTYSHAINPELPICRYELDGVCNDASCRSQHFKSLGLSDEKILVDLGTTPQDSDANAYTKGLKLLVQDIRSRRIKDVNKVASEITAYRRKFLGETRVISM